jgi:molecular chaperone DnaK (HSP70)
LQVDTLSLVPFPGRAAPEIVFSWEPRSASIGAGSAVRFTFRAEAGRPVAAGYYSYVLAMRTNEPEAVGKPRTMKIHVTKAVRLGCVAMDYGTIDSTMAFYDDNAGSVNIQLGDARDPKIYSNVFFSNYMDGQDPPFQWEIGALAAELGATNQEQLVTAAKVRVGKGHKEVLWFASLGTAVELESEKVVALAMRTLLYRARTVLRQQITKVALCVPTRFTLRRKELLRMALSEASRRLEMEVTVTLHDESLAAGVFSLLKGGAARHDAEATIMVVDFGGGTTDVTVFRVRRGIPGAALAVDIIGAWGDPELGGELITDMLARQLLAKFNPRFDPKSDTPPAGLHQITPDAERLKVAVSELETAKRKAKQDGKRDDDPLDVIDALDEVARQRLGYLCLLDAAATPDKLVECVDAYLRNGILPVRSLSLRRDRAVQSPLVVEFPAGEVVRVFGEKLANLKCNLQSLLRKISQAEGITLEKVDTLLLAGQSSRFPTVREELQDIGTEVTFVKDDEGKPLLKECVSRGALMLVGELLKVEGQDRLWARLGYVTGARFRELIGWGTRYPGQSEWIAFGRNDVVQGKLQIEIKENLTLDRDLPTARFGVFSLAVGGGPEPYRFQLRLDKEAGVQGVCRFGDEPEERTMEYEP